MAVAAEVQMLVLEAGHVEEEAEEEHFEAEEDCSD